MRTAFVLGRTCFRFQGQAARPRILQHVYSRLHTGQTHSFSIWRHTKHAFRSPPSPIKGGIALFAALSPTAFVTISQAEEEEDGLTGEARMLAASREEIDNYVPEALRGSKHWRVMVWRFLDTWIIEPIATGVRFLHLVAIFVPVMITFPVVFIGPRRSKDGETALSIWWYGCLVWAMKSAGASFIKLGQWAATRSDIFPKELCDRMSSLHSEAPAHSLKVTKRTIEKAFGKKFDEIFDEFNETPLGVGAIAQVYKARLKPEFATTDDAVLDEPQTFGERARKTVDPILKSSPQRTPSNYVAIKVLHPGIEKNVRRDLRIMGFFASLINAIPTMEWLSFPDEVQQFGAMMKLQLDLRIESANLVTFRKNFRSRSTAWFPYPYIEYSSRQVLVEEFATGIPLEDFMVNGGGVFHAELADEGLDAFLHMLLIDNFIHADLHPGNIMVRFHQPAPVDVSLSLRRRRDKPLAKNTKDVTEEVLERLRPHRKDQKAWIDALAQIDKEGFRPQLIFIDTGLVTELNATNRKNFLE
ncbi:hypothetical protein AMS68_000265 [Peltaster fructicola]|uniref:Protein kinase domain-containing protein n=1 Tax=Peltaster fructicola TaxID=286661 RepID=A0A6H0XJD0_9PEZI|nr:hypothetical protein AMS68_000265 [Peltaster fructicola]